MKFESTTQRISWFRDRYLEGTLTLKPSYQRNAVWMERQKNWLVETVLKNLPVPEVFIQITTDDEGTTEYAVVDGQQRVRSLLQFVGADADESQGWFPVTVATRTIRKGFSHVVTSCSEGAGS